MERVGNNNNENNKNLSSVIKLNEKKQKEEEQCGLMDFSYSLKNTTKKRSKKLIKIAQFQMVPFSWCRLAFSIKEKLTSSLTAIFNFPMERLREVLSTQYN